MERRQLFRSRSNRKLCGVCGGIGEYLGIDPTFIRLFWVLLLIIRPWRIVFHFHFGWSVLSISIIIYIIAAIVIPVREHSRHERE